MVEPEPVLVLVRPQMGENVGSAARAMLNFGLTRLRLVAPQFGWPNAKAVNAASGAHVVLNRLEVFETLEAALADCQTVFATTARPREWPKPVFTAEAAACALRPRAMGGAQVAVLFGPERTGLETDDLRLCDAIVTVPLNPDYSSLNLAQAVLLVAYEWYRAGDATAPVTPIQPPEGRRLANKAELAALIDHLVAELDEVDFWRVADRRASLIRALTGVLARAELFDSDAHLLHGVIKSLAGKRRRG